MRSKKRPNDLAFAAAESAHTAERKLIETRCYEEGSEWRKKYLESAIYALKQALRNAEAALQQVEKEAES